ncbi:phosphotransferase [Haliea sp. E1-2-M8]|uniref:phosphotransferase n=1 Tax=Haliea sp. E1-2-M8 TaxID=3064706 RepID=UPI0027273375|nr:phosphotransferase [Haliea sp. E1-2-M8]MDO8863783.1 phosphotransferase [Haliea sp. E1-2-M8]
MTPEFISGLLHELGFAEHGENPVIEALSGGVSSEILKVTVGSGIYCIKQALPKLKVEKDWSVPTDRVFSEIAWLHAADRIVPGHAPRVLGVDRRAGAFVMEFLSTESHHNWKTLLVSGIVEADSGRQVASVLGRLHAATAGDRNSEKQFSKKDNFYLLRLEPYLIEAAKQNPDLAEELIDIVQSVQKHRLALVHGDVSPKNIFLGPEGAIFLDAECACFSDPAFDVAFLLNHMLLKSVLLPDQRDELLLVFDRIWTEYKGHVNWESSCQLEKRIVKLLPALLLARVDGKSPVDYLSNVQGSGVRTFARDLLIHPADTLDDFVTAWSEDLDPPGWTVIE